MRGLVTVTLRVQHFMCWCLSGNEVCHGVSLCSCTCSTFYDNVASLALLCCQEQKCWHVKMKGSNDEIMPIADFVQQGNFIDVFLVRHVSGAYAHHREHWISCSVRFSAPSFWMGGGLESRCVGRLYGADGAVRHHLQQAPSAPCSYTKTN